MSVRLSLSPKLPDFLLKRESFYPPPLHQLTFDTRESHVTTEPLGTHRTCPTEEKSGQVGVSSSEGMDTHVYLCTRT